MSDEKSDECICRFEGIHLHDPDCPLASKPAADEKLREFWLVRRAHADYICESNPYLDHAIHVREVKK